MNNFFSELKRRMHKDIVHVIDTEDVEQIEAVNLMV